MSCTVGTDASGTADNCGPGHLQNAQKYPQMSKHPQHPPQIPNLCSMCGCPCGAALLGWTGGSWFWGTQVPRCRCTCCEKAPTEATSAFPKGGCWCTPSPISWSDCCPITAATSLPASTNSLFFATFQADTFLQKSESSRAGDKQPPARSGIPDRLCLRPHCPGSPYLAGSAGSPKPCISPPSPSSWVLSGRTSSRHRTPLPQLYFTDKTQGTCWKSSSCTRRHCNDNIHRHHRLSSAFPDNPAPAAV